MLPEFMNARVKCNSCTIEYTYTPFYQGTLLLCASCYAKEKAKTEATK